MASCSPPSPRSASSSARHDGCGVTLDAAAVVLAGGRAGAAAPLRSIDGATVLDRQLAALAAADVVDVALSVTDPVPPALAEAARHRGLALVADHGPGHGPLGGLLAAL